MFRFLRSTTSAMLNPPHSSTTSRAAGCSRRSKKGRKRAPGRSRSAARTSLQPSISYRQIVSGRASCSGWTTPWPVSTCSLAAISYSRTAPATPSSACRAAFSAVRRRPCILRARSSATPRFSCSRMSTSPRPVITRGVRHFSGLIAKKPVDALLSPAAASSAAPARVGIGRLDAFCAKIHDDDAVRLETVREQRRGYSAASGLALTLLDHLHRALIRQRRNRIVAERERGGQAFDQLRLRRFLLVALGRARVRDALDSGAVEKLVVGLVADPLAEGTEIGIGSRLERVIGLRHLCGCLRHVSLEGRVGALHAGGEAYLLPRRGRLGARDLREQHQSRQDTNNSFHSTSPFNEHFNFDTAKVRQPRPRSRGMVVSITRSGAKGI